MKKIIALLIPICTFSQVGINTQTPSATLDIVSQGNNASTKALKITNSSAAKLFTVLDNGTVGVGTDSPNAKLDIRTTPTSTTDPGEGMLGIGTTATAASTAGAGAIRYSTLSGGTIDYSDGTTWRTLQSNVRKSLVTAKKWTTTQSISFPSAALIVNWVEVTDINGDFDPVTGVFTAPRNGVYTISATLGFQSANDYKGWVETIISVVNSAGNEIASYKTASAAVSNGNAIDPGAPITATISLSAGQKVRIFAYNSTQRTINLRYNSGSTPSDEGYNNLNIIEN